MSSTNSGPRADDLAYVRFAAPDLEVMHTFLNDFGMHVTHATTPDGVPVLYSRGNGGDPVIHIAEQAEEPKFAGLGFLMSSEQDLEALAAMDGASAIEEMVTPGGGQCVRFTDPDGIRLEAFYGWEKVAGTIPEQRVPINSGEHRRRVGDPVRLKAGPSHVKRLGHVVLFVTDFRTSEAWYNERFGFIASDYIWAGEESNVIGAFMRCNRGELPADHHTIFLMTSQDHETRPPGSLQHAAFEVNDWDDVMVGHDYLAEREYNPQWGIGKHILGSQVFDYWRDPYGHIVEHFTDGDLFDASRPPEMHPVETVLSVQWGATFPH